MSVSEAIHTTQEVSANSHPSPLMHVSVHSGNLSQPYAVVV